MSAVTTRVSNDLRNRIVAVLREDRDVRNIGALADQLESAIRGGDPVAWLRHGEETPVQNMPFGAMWISDKDDPRAFPVYDHPPQPAPSVAAKVTSESLEQFTAYFVKNYPGPDTIIFDPKWHAPKIFRAAVSALSAHVQDAVGLERLRDVTYAVQHNPNCPAKYLVRLVGKSGRIDLKPYGNHFPSVKHETGDVLGFGKTLDEAIDNAIAAAAPAKQEGK